MAVYIDQITTHSGSNTGDDTVPPGISALDWCHLVSSVSEAELLGFVVANFLSMGVDPLNIRTPLLGSVQTYYGLDVLQRAAAVGAGALPGRVVTVRAVGFDAPGGAGPFWEP